MPPSESDSQNPIFLERLQGLFSRQERDGRHDEDSAKNGVVIATCLFLSFLLWFIFTMQETYTAEFEMPTAVTNVPADQALASLPPSHVRVRVQGEGFQLLQLALNTPNIPIDARTGQVDVQGAINLPAGLTAQSILPEQITIETEPRQTRRIPIRLRGQIHTPPTHELLEEPTVEPDSVVVAGAQSIVFNLHTWPTDSLILQDVRDSVTAEVALADTLRGLVTRSVNQVQVHAVADRFTEGVRDVEVRVAGGPGRAVTLDPSVVEVRYRVLLDQYQEAQQAQDFFAEVNFEEIRDDTTGYVRPTLNLPAGLDIRDPRMIPSRLRYYHFIPSE